MHAISCSRLTVTPEESSTQVQIVSATPEQESTIANLLELYAHDFSEFHHLELSANGRFGYKDLPLYWKEADHYPFLIRVEGRLAGLALVKSGSRGSETGASSSMKEFFIVRAYRRQGFGMKAAHELWRMFPGWWEVRVMKSNRTGVKFWPRATTTFGGAAIHPDHIEKDGKWWYVFAFECKQAVVRTRSGL